MRILYPYNEILPRRKAHDVFIFQQCLALAFAGCNVTLLCGKGSERKVLFKHYEACPSPHLHIETLPIVRKNNLLNISWNFPFFYCSQRYIRENKPDCVFLSVRKQGAYHLSRKIPGVRYLYEVHELSYYPGIVHNRDELRMEKRLFERADQITVTTHALKEILQAPPYSISVPIEVIPLAVRAEALPPPLKGDLTVMYAGQLYEGQGLPLLLAALAKVKGIRLKIAGGREEEIARLTQKARELGIEKWVDFLGFIPPSQLSSLMRESHAFVAPFENTGRMPFVAHTKLFEYAEWGRPIIAPELSVVKEHFSSGTLLFEPGNVDALAECLTALKEESVRRRLQGEIEVYSGKFSWKKRAEHYLQFLNEKN